MLICVFGKKRSGKDTVANYLCEYHGFKKAPPFAVFKYALAQWFDWDERHLEGSLKEVVDPRWGFSPRTILQIFGSELMKEDLGTRIPEYKAIVGNDIWAKVFSTWYEKQDPDDKFVVADLRFPEEAKELARFNDVVYIRIERDTGVGQDTHVSESHFDELPMDFAIENNDSLEELYDRVDSVLNSMNMYDMY